MKGSDVITLCCGSCSGREAVTVKKAKKKKWFKNGGVKTLVQIERLLDSDGKMKISYYYDCDECCKLPTEDDIYDNDNY